MSCWQWLVLVDDGKPIMYFRHPWDILLLCIYSLNIHIQLIHIQTKLLNNLLPHVQLRDPVHQQDAAVVGQQFAVQHEAESRIVTYFLALIVCSFDQNVVDYLWVLFDSFNSSNHRILRLGRNIVVNGRPQNHLCVLGDSKAHQAIFGIDQWS